MKYLIYLILILYSLNTVYAIDKILLNIPDCYNVTVKHIDLYSGNKTSITFNGCILYNNTWTCNCAGINDYNLTLQSDNTPLYYNDIRKYHFIIQYTSYAFSYFNDSIYATDDGLGLDINSENNVGIGQNIIYRDVPYYLYTDKVINNITYKNVTVYVNKNVTQIVYKDNITKIDELIYSYNKSLNKSNNNKIIWMVSTIILAVLLLFFVYKMRINNL
jgi:hypothetical protein